MYGISNQRCAHFVYCAKARQSSVPYATDYNKTGRPFYPRILPVRSTQTGRQVGGNVKAPLSHFSRFTSLVKKCNTLYCTHATAVSIPRNSLLCSFRRVSHSYRSCNSLRVLCMETSHQCGQNGTYARIYRGRSSNGTCTRDMDTTRGYRWNVHYWRMVRATAPACKCRCYYALYKSERTYRFV